MIRTRKLFALLVFCMTMVFSLGSISASHLERIEASPDWVKKLSAAQNAKLKRPPLVTVLPFSCIAWLL